MRAVLQTKPVNAVTTATPDHSAAEAESPSLAAGSCDISPSVPPDGLMDAPSMLEQPEGFAHEIRRSPGLSLQGDPGGSTAILHRGMRGSS